jgi:hypothetical protein
MLIPILKGTTEIVEKVKDGETITNGCPQCHQDLLLKQFRTWNTLFMIPLTPSGETRFVYECVSCQETFDPVYRNTFINRAKYLNATPKEVKILTDELSLDMLAAVLKADNRSQDNIIDVLKDFAISRGIDIETHEEKFDSAFLTQGNVSEVVFETYNIFRDCFAEEYRNRALNQVLKFCSTISLSEKETKQLYTFSRHWGLTKEQFEEQLTNKL